MYLQRMLQLPKTHPGVQLMCQNGFHAIRRGDKFCAGLSSDLVTLWANSDAKSESLWWIAQGTLNRSAATLHTAVNTPVTQEMNRSMQEFTYVKYQTSDQQKDLSLCRIQRNCQDVIEFFEFQIEFLKECIPFNINTVLINLNSGEAADEYVNVFQTQAIWKSLIQHLISDIERRTCPLTTEVSDSVNIKDSAEEVYPQLFFQRLLASV